MGSSYYSADLRSERAVSAGYFTKSTNDIFEQNKLRRIHESMEPSKAMIRESRDSDNHPNSVPIIIALDVTGSMGKIPHLLVKDGLPTIMSGIIQNGIPDPQVLFLAVGDATCDRYPLQVGQFESGDSELDMWLTRTYIEGGGGGNDGESYSLAWYYAANHTVTDAWEKRNQRGFLFTIGDEPIHSNLGKGHLREIFNEGGYQGGTTNEELLKMAEEKYNVYHIHVAETSAGQRSLEFWENLMGQKCISVKNHEDIPNVIAKIVSENAEKTILENKGENKSVNTDNVDTKIEETKDEDLMLL